MSTLFLPLHARANISVSRQYRIRRGKALSFLARCVSWSLGGGGPPPGPPCGGPAGTPPPAPCSRRSAVRAGLLRSARARRPLRVGPPFRRSGPPGFGLRPRPVGACARPSLGSALPPLASAVVGGLPLRPFGLGLAPGLSPLRARPVLSSRLALRVPPARPAASGGGFALAPPRGGRGAAAPFPAPRASALPRVLLSITLSKLPLQQKITHGINGGHAGR